MNDTAIATPVFPNASTYRVVARLQLQGIGAVSTERLSRLNHLIATVSPHEEELAAFGQPPWPETEDEPWSEAKNQRRCDLIDRKYQGGLTPVETRELDRLQAQMLRYRQRVAPLPVEYAQRLYEQLLAEVSASRGSTAQ